MGPGGFGGLCLALLCSGAALGFQEEEPGTENVPMVTVEGTLEPPEPSEPPGHPSAATEDGDTVTSSPPWSGDPVVTPAVTTEVTPAVTLAVTTVVTPAVTTAENRTRTSSGVPARYWSPVIFVVLALLVLFVAYHRTKDKGIRDVVMSGSDSSDLGALVQPHTHEPTPKIPSPKIPTLHREEKDPETPPGPELRETSFGHSDTPDSPPGGS